MREDANDQQSENKSSIPPVDRSRVDSKHSAILARLLLEDVDLESTSKQRSPACKHVLYMQHTCSGEPQLSAPAL